MTPRSITDLAITDLAITDLACARSRRGRCPDSLTERIEPWIEP